MKPWFGELSRELTFTKAGVGALFSNPKGFTLRNHTDRREVKTQMICDLLEFVVMHAGRSWIVSQRPDPVDDKPNRDLAFLMGSSKPERSPPSSTRPTRRTTPPRPCGIWKRATFGARW